MFGSLFVPLTGDSTGLLTLNAALAIAKRFDAHARGK